MILFNSKGIRSGCREIFPQGANRNTDTANPGIFLKEIHPEFAALITAFLCIKEHITVGIYIPKLSVCSQGRAFCNTNIAFSAPAGAYRFTRIFDTNTEKDAGKP